MKIHFLVMLAFVGPRPDGMEVCHNDGDSTNNHLDNLRYDTHLANMADYRNHRLAQLSADDVQQIREAWAAGQTLAQIAEQWAISRAFASDICNGRVYEHCSGPIVPWHKVNTQVIAQIQQCRKEGLSFKKIAALLGCSKATVLRIARGDFPDYYLRTLDEADDLHEITQAKASVEEARRTLAGFHPNRLKR